MAFEGVEEKRLPGRLGRRLRARRIVVEPFDPNAEDGDGDGLVQDGSRWERPGGPEIAAEGGRKRRSRLGALPLRPSTGGGPRPVRRARRSAELADEVAATKAFVGEVLADEFDQVRAGRSQRLTKRKTSLHPYEVTPDGQMLHEAVVEAGSAILGYVDRRWGRRLARVDGQIATATERHERLRAEVMGDGTRSLRRRQQDLLNERIDVLARERFGIGYQELLGRAGVGSPDDIDRPRGSNKWQRAAKELQRDATAGDPELVAAGRELTAAQERLRESARGLMALRGRREVLLRDALTDGLQAAGVELSDGSEIRFQQPRDDNGVERVKALQAALRFLPKAWTRQAGELSEPLAHRESDRGNARKALFSRFGFDLVELNRRRSWDENANAYFAVAAHEVGHLVELPEVRLMEHLFYATRTSGDPLESYGKDGKEFVRSDQFFNRYAGKTYGDRPGSNYELLAMATGRMFGLDRKPSREGDTLDREYLAWMLGVMATVEPGHTTDELRSLQATRTAQPVSTPTADPLQGLRLSTSPGVGRAQQVEVTDANGETVAVVEYTASLPVRPGERGSLEIGETWVAPALRDRGVETAVVERLRRLHDAPAVPLRADGDDDRDGWVDVEEIVDWSALDEFDQFDEDGPGEDELGELWENTLGDWARWDPCREIRVAAYELAGLEQAALDPNLQRQGGYFGNGRNLAASPEKRTEQARWLMGSLVEAARAGRGGEPMYRALDLDASQRDGFAAAVTPGAVVDVPLLAFSDRRAQGAREHLTDYGTDALLVVEGGAARVDGNVMHALYDESAERKTLIRIEDLLDEVEGGVEADGDDDEYVTQLVESTREALSRYEATVRSGGRDRVERRRELVELIGELTGDESEVFGEPMRWAGDEIDEDDGDFYWDAVEGMDSSLAVREEISGGRFEVVAVEDDPDGVFGRVVRLRQVGVFDPQRPGVVVTGDGDLEPTEARVDVPVNPFGFGDGNRPWVDAAGPATVIRDDRPSAEAPTYRTPLGAEMWSNPADREALVGYFRRLADDTDAREAAAIEEAEKAARDATRNRVGLAAEGEAVARLNQLRQQQGQRSAQMRRTADGLEQTFRFVQAAERVDWDPGRVDIGTYRELLEASEKVQGSEGPPKFQFERDALLDWLVQVDLRLAPALTGAVEMPELVDLTIRPGEPGDGSAGSDRLRASILWRSPDDVYARTAAQVAKRRLIEDVAVGVQALDPGLVRRLEELGADPQRALRDAADRVTRSWASSSTSDLALVVQAHVAEMMGVDAEAMTGVEWRERRTNAELLAEFHDPANTLGSEVFPAFNALPKEQRPDAATIAALDRRFIEGYVRSVYRNTQGHLAALGVDDLLVSRGTVYRPDPSWNGHPMEAVAREVFEPVRRADGEIVGWEPRFVRRDGTLLQREMEGPRRPLASWSLSEDTALEFAEQGNAPEGWVSMLSTAVVPRQAVFSYPGVGLGSYFETEVVVVGGPGRELVQAWTVSGRAKSWIFDGDDVDGFYGDDPRNLGADVGDRRDPDPATVRQVAQPVALPYEVGNGGDDSQRSRAAMQYRRSVRASVDELLEGLDGEDAEAVEAYGRDELVAQAIASAVEAVPGLVDSYRSGMPVVGITGDALESVLRDGRYLTQYESGTSGGLFSPDQRRRVESTQMGIPEGLEDRLRPVYGYIPVDSGLPLSLDDAARWYGNFAIVPKESVRDRTTITLGDSLDDRLHPVPLTGPELDADRARAATGQGFVDDVALGGLIDALESAGLESIADGFRMTEEPYDESFAKYVETQIHGGLTVADIDHIVAGNLAMDQEDYPELFEPARRPGIQIREDW